MHSRSLRGVRPLVLTAAISGVILLAACGPVNAGSAGKEAFEEAFAADPAVASMDLSSSNDLPWAGVVSGTVVAAERIDESELGELVDRIGAYAVERHAGASVSVDLSADGVVFPVFESRERNAAIVEVAAGLREDDRVLSAVLDVRYGSSVSSVEMVAAGADAAFELGMELSEAVEPLALEEGFQAEVATEDGAVLVEGRPGPWLERGAQVWESVGRQVEVSGIHVTPEVAELRIAEELHVSEATEIAEPLLSGSGMRLTVSSELLQLGEGVDGEATRDLFASLGDEAVALVRSSWTGEDALHVRAGSADDLIPLAQALGERPEAGAFSTIALFADGSEAADGSGRDRSGWDGVSDGDGISVYAPPADLAERTAAGVSVAQAGGIEAVLVARERIEATVSASVPPSELFRFAPVLKAAARAGDRVCVEPPAQGSLCVAAADVLSDDELADHEREGGPAFVDAWNASPPLGG